MCVADNGARDRCRACARRVEDDLSHCQSRSKTRGPAAQSQAPGGQRKSTPRIAPCRSQAIGSTRHDGFGSSVQGMVRPTYSGPSPQSNRLRRRGVKAGFCYRNRSVMTRRSRQRSCLSASDVRQSQLSGLATFTAPMNPASPRQDPLPSWNEGSAKQSVMNFVQGVISLAVR